MALLLALTLVLSACGGTENNSEEATSTSEQTETTSSEETNTSDESEETSEAVSSEEDTADSEEEISDTASTSEEADVTYDTDVVVVGAGGTGLSAAVEARDQGLDVIVVEKRTATGGAFIGSEGMFGIESAFQKEADIDTTVAEALERVMDYHHYLNDYELTKNFFELSGETITWLDDKGVGIQSVQGLGDSIESWHLYEGTRADGLGLQFMKSLTQVAEDAGVEILLETPAKEVIMKDGKAAGIIAENKDGETVQVNAPVVILGTGGFSDSPEMMEEYVGVDSDNIATPINAGRTGDGIKMGIEAGGHWNDFPGTTAFYGPQLPDEGYGSDTHAVSIQPILWVNQDAQRFIREDMYHTNFAYAGNAMKLNDRTFTILDQATLDQYVAEGPDVQVGVYVEPGTPLDKAQEVIDKKIEDGEERYFKADTIEELAEMTGLDPAALQETIDEYNEFCANGVDEEFNKPADYLHPIENGPYYAFDVANGYFCTLGGLEVSPNAEVLDENGEPIPGLYAGGCDAGGLYADSYDVVTAAGSQAGWAVNSGRLAAQHAAEYLNNNEQ